MAWVAWAVLPSMYVRVKSCLYVFLFVLDRPKEEAIYYDNSACMPKSYHDCSYLFQLALAIFHSIFSHVPLQTACVSLHLVMYTDHAIRLSVYTNSGTLYI